MADSSHFQSFLFIFGIFKILQTARGVVELDESFKELKKEGYWFVEFYAPWCGHCKNLEPIWEEVDLELKQTSSIVTAKLDCTKYRELAEGMEIRGFPTIKFFRGEVSTAYRGSRSKDALVEFAMKASRPILTEFKTTENFENRRKKAEVFFVFVKDESETSEEYKEIVKAVAEKKIAQVMFYSIMSKSLSKDIKLEKTPNLLVFKDNSYASFEDEDRTLNKMSVSKWVDQEKFPSFVFVKDSDVDELADTGKKIVFVVFAKESEKRDLNKRLGEIVKRLALQLNTKLGRHFQFAGLMDSKIVESIMMSTAELPFILVFEPQSRIYYFLSLSAMTETFDESKLSLFLEDVMNGKATAYGGRSIMQHIWRMWWEFRTSAKDIWAANPWVALAMFGLPVLVFTFLAVMLCFLDVEPENEQHEEEIEQSGEQGDEREIEEPVQETKPGRLKVE